MVVMRVPRSTHLATPWVISRIAPDFELLDAWVLPVVGRQEDFARFLDVVARLDPTTDGSWLSNLLFAVRLRLGEALGWDDRQPRSIPGCPETSLADRLPAELRGTARLPALRPAVTEKAGGFTPLYRTHDEWAAEISNATVHGVLQLSWVPLGNGRYGGRLAVWVKNRGALGRAYLLLIAPFRHLVVYPALLRQIGRAWQEEGITQ